MSTWIAEAIFVIGFWSLRISSDLGCMFYDFSRLIMLDLCDGDFSHLSGFGDFIHGCMLFL